MSNSKSSFEDGIWRGPRVPPPAEHHQLGEALLAAMTRNAELVGQIDSETGQEDSYGSMADRSARCALWLRRRGVKPGDVISLCTGKNLNHMISILSSLFVGAIANPWRDDFDEDNLLKIVKLVNPKILFVDKNNGLYIKKIFTKSNIDVTLICFQKNKEITSLDEILSTINVEEVKSFKCTPVESPSQPAAIIFTSGTTGGTPKGALLSYGALSNSVSLAEPIFNGNPSLAINKSFWISELVYGPNAILAGTTIIQGVTSADAHTFDLIQRYKVQWLTITVVHFGQIFKYAPHLINSDVSTVKYVWIGGGALSDKVIKKLTEWFSCAQIMYSYGLTEMCGRGAMAICAYRKPGTSGKLFQNVELKVIDNDGNKIKKPYVKGQFCINGPTRMIGYYNDPEATADAFDDEGFFRTGDYGYFDADGDIYITDRLKDMIRSVAGGMSSTAIEHVVRDHPGVLDAAVVVKMSEAGFEMPFAFVVKHPDYNVTENEIINFVDEQNLPLINLEGGVQFIKSLPRAATGKIKKAELRKLAGSRALSQLL